MAAEPRRRARKFGSRGFPAPDEQRGAPRISWRVDDRRGVDFVRRRDAAARIRRTRIQFQMEYGLDERPLAVCRAQSRVSALQPPIDHLLLRVRLVGEFHLADLA